MPTSTSNIVLESESFALHGQRGNDQDWFEFEARISDKKFARVGGADRLHFIDSLMPVLSKEHGVSLSQLKTAPYAEHVGGLSSEYLGQIVFSGYNTIYFFTENNKTRHVILADRNGRFLAHAGFSPNVCAGWLEELRRVRSHSSYD